MHTSCWIGFFDAVLGATHWASQEAAGSFMSVTLFTASGEFCRNHGQPPLTGGRNETSSPSFSSSPAAPYSLFTERMMWSLYLAISGNLSM